MLVANPARRKGKFLPNRSEQEQMPHVFAVQERVRSGANRLARLPAPQHTSHINCLTIDH